MKLKIKMKIKVDIVDFDHINLYMFTNENVHHSLQNHRYQRYCIGINLYNYVKKKKLSIFIVDIFLCPQLKLSIFVVDIDNIDDFVSISIRICTQRYFGKLYQAYQSFFFDIDDCVDIILRSLNTII